MTGTTEGMVGGGYYDAHSTFQAAVAESGKTLLQNAVAALSLTASGEATIADYGCSEGRNSMATIGSALELLAGRGVAGFGVLHNDLPTNDWLSLAKNLSSPDSYLARFPQARALFAPRGFFERVTLPSSVTLGTSGSAVHWLSRQPPDLDMPRSLYRSDAPASELAKNSQTGRRRLAGLSGSARRGIAAGWRTAGSDARLRRQQQSRACQRRGFVEADE